MEMVAAGLAGALAVTVLLRVFARIRARRSFDEAVDRVFEIALGDAGELGHPQMTLEHLALALVTDPSVASDLEARGLSSTELSAAIEALLPPRGEELHTLTPSDVEHDVVLLLQDAAVSKLTRVGTEDLLDALASGAREPFRMLFKRRTPAAKAAQPEPTNTDLPSGGPYRDPPAAHLDTAVVFWNDDKTQQVFVRNLLRNAFNVPGPQATALMLRVHLRGRAVVGLFERDEAERLVALALEASRAAGYPLAITLEPRSDAAP